MKNRLARGLPETGAMDGHLSTDELSVVLSALWLRRAQLSGVGSPSAEAQKSIAQIVRKLGGDPEAYFFGLKPDLQHY